VPVCPVTLRPPPVEVESERERSHSSTPETSVGTTLDPLGHALRDQTASARPPAPLAPRTTTEHIRPPKGISDPLPLPVPEQDHNPTSDFIVVGAALLKKRPRTLDPEPTSVDDTVQRQHRKLLPPDLRPGARTLPWSYQTFKDRKARRKAWIDKEIEKVEGYTGERVTGFQYDGDDVIIHINKRRHYGGDHQSSKPMKHHSIRPPPVERRQHQTSHAHTSCTNVAPALRPSTGVYASSSSDNRSGDARECQPEASADVGPDIADGGTIDDAANIRPPPSDLQRAVNIIPPAAEGPPPSEVDIPDNMAALAEPTSIQGTLGATESRGLSFLTQ
jgi:hypothetical protein